jgi:hypothetical protein
VRTSRISWVAYATEDSGSLAKIGRASRFGSSVSPIRSLRSGRPTSSRFIPFTTITSQGRDPVHVPDLDGFLTATDATLTGP